MAETWNKRERERKKRQEKKEKLEKKQERKHNKSSHTWTEMLAYVDENGNLSSKPTDSGQSL
jgi:CspA family cold shock protein